MASDFIDSFGQNTDTMLDRFYLEKLKKKPTETFKEFGTRWRAEAAKVEPPMKDAEIVATFICIQEDIYFDKMLNL